MLKSDKDFVVIEITQEMKTRAFCRATRLGELNNSITKGEGNKAGFLGEDAVKQFLKAEYSRGENKYNHDLVLNGFEIEVKTKRRTVRPTIHYEVSIAETSTHQNPDYYIFTSVDNKNVWLLGYISTQEFFARADFIPKGSIDPSNNFTCHRNMYNLKHQKLYPIKDFVKCISH